MGKNIVCASKLVPQFSFFFVKFDFSCFFLYFFENEQYQRRLKCGKSMILKMTREKLNAFKRPLKKNLNSFFFLDDVENAKMTKIY